MFPFPASWLSMLSVPCLLMIKDRKKMAMINQVFFIMVYAPISLVTLSLFMAVNLALLPFAYLKTLVHKIVLWRVYKGKSQAMNFFVFLLLGIPMLLLSQFTDAFYFILHSYSTKQNHHLTDTKSKYKITLSDFKRLLDTLNQLVDTQGVTKISAERMVLDQRLEMGVMTHISDVIFGQSENAELAKISVEKIKTYNSIKNAIWSCVFDDDLQLDLVLLRALMLELQVYLDLIKLKAIHEKQRLGHKDDTITYNYV